MFSDPGTPVCTRFNKGFELELELELVNDSALAKATVDCFPACMPPSSDYTSDRGPVLGRLSLCFVTLHWQDNGMTVLTRTNSAHASLKICHCQKFWVKLIKHFSVNSKFFEKVYDIDLKLSRDQEPTPVRCPNPMQSIRKTCQQSSWPSWEWLPGANVLILFIFSPQSDWAVINAISPLFWAAFDGAFDQLQSIRLTLIFEMTKTL